MFCEDELLVLEEDDETGGMTVLVGCDDDSVDDRLDDCCLDCSPCCRPASRPPLLLLLTAAVPAAVIHGGSRLNLAGFFECIRLDLFPAASSLPVLAVPCQRRALSELTLLALRHHQPGMVTIKF